MTDEELQQTVRELDEDINKLSNRDKPLTAEEDRQRNLLLLKKETLQKLKEARDKGNFSQEMNQTINYGLLSAWGEKHPFLMYLLRLKFRSHLNM